MPGFGRIRASRARRDDEGNALRIFEEEERRAWRSWPSKRAKVSRRGTSTYGGSVAETPFERLDAAVRRIGEYVERRPPPGVSHDDADDTVGTIGCDEAFGFDPLVLLAALDRHGARAVVIGQVAGIMHGSQELTGDVDLLWRGEPSEAPKFAAAFADVGASLFDDEHRPLPLDTGSFALPKLLFQSAGASGDCCTPQLPWGSLDVAGIIERADAASVGGVTVHYASLTDLVAMRQASARPKDVRRAAELCELALRGR